MPSNVSCEVANCTFNMQGNRCGADEIMVISHVGGQAREQKETDCKTFQPK
ncbi:DUF1540 domain-containing protein [Hazenella sp. IB182357]|uniref:DUF1540 domain-containing protein n=1 Tax=Polycladospora coralii TaxID=2771432 RepID=A0A926N8T8_9BACL|nr:DUF1540 domain-containing protein [Polycladospora coralii]MBD1370930.1 DUF1540 domain-containing protein [Polycladospora coralii]MBS7529869.1 DUF1540 domain-containing protein [Polycladospora coralii]